MSPALAIRQPAERVLTWPTQPYKGLDYYVAEDIPIFAGRDDDVELCAQLFASSATRIFILHGSTGCGKSSFLRAGLIPFLERREHGYSFVRDAQQDLATSYLVRSTDDPLSRLAESVFRVAREPYCWQSPAGPASLDLSTCMPEPSDLRTLLPVTPDDLVQTLVCFASKLPGTLVWIVDQVKEVITLKPGKYGETERRSFFRFLRLFMRCNVDMKVLLVIRTEYYGRLLAYLRRTAYHSDRIGSYLLAELSEEQLIEAITRPCSDQPVDSFGVPRDHYRFEFADDLPQLIARELQEAVPAGGVLPVMQLVCSRLYRSRAQSGRDALAIITLSDYQRLHGVKGQIQGYLTDTLRLMCEKDDIGKQDIDSEIVRWCGILMNLTKLQVDGTVTTELKPATKLKEEAEKAGCHVRFESGAEFLSRPEYRILRSVTVFNPTAQKEIPCFVLGHDAIGLALRNLAGQMAPVQTLKDIQGACRSLFILVLATFIFLNGGYWLSRLFWSVDGQSYLSLLTVGAVYLAAAALMMMFPIQSYVALSTVMATYCRFLGMHESAHRWRGLVERARLARDLTRES